MASAAGLVRVFCVRCSPGVALVTLHESLVNMSEQGFPSWGSSPGQVPHSELARLPAPPAETPACLLRAVLIDLAVQAAAEECVSLPEHVLGCPTCRSRFDGYRRAAVRAR